MATASGNDLQVARPRVNRMANLKGKRTWGSLAFDNVNVVLMFVLMIAMFYPILNVVAVSLSTPGAIISGRVSWFPVGINLEGYRIILGEPRLGRTYLNTIAYAAGGTAMTLLFTSMVAYSMAIREFVVRKHLTIFFVITMFFNGGLIPTYLIIRQLGLLNTYWVMVLPTAIVAYNVFVFRTFFQSTIPPDIRESAFMDGATDTRILFQIYLPLSKPLLATFGLFSIVRHWNSWFNALVFLRDSDRYPVQMLLRRIVIENSFDSLGEEAVMALQSMSVNPKNVQMAAVVVVLLPIMLLYPFVQKYFTKGVMLGSIKG